MRILHLFNWRLQDIIPYLDLISSQGFDSIQINPIQPLKNEDASDWWMSYQPIRFDIGNRFGSREDLMRLCDEARKRNIRIIADVVCNHMAGKDNGELRPHEKVDSRLTSRADFWKEDKRISNWDDRYQVTHYSIGLPGLNVWNRDLQDIIIDFLNELIDCGVDGFRFDAAKSIALPEEYCEFWPRVIYCLKKYGLELYGEVLNSDPSLIEKYAKYMRVLTDGYAYNPDSIVKFAESHDTYLGFGFTKNKSSSEIVNNYVDLTNIYNNTLFYARPFDDSWKSHNIECANKRLIKK